MTPRYRRIRRVVSPAGSEADDADHVQQAGVNRSSRHAVSSDDDDTNCVRRRSYDTNSNSRRSRPRAKTRNNSSSNLPRASDGEQEQRLSRQLDRQGADDEAFNDRRKQAVANHWPVSQRQHSRRKEEERQISLLKVDENGAEVESEEDSQDDDDDTPSDSMKYMSNSCPQHKKVPPGEAVGSVRRRSPPSSEVHEELLDYHKQGLNETCSKSKGGYETCSVMCSTTGKRVPQVDLGSFGPEGTNWAASNPRHNTARLNITARQVRLLSTVRAFPHITHHTYWKNAFCRIRRKNRARNGSIMWTGEPLSLDERMPKKTLLGLVKDVEFHSEEIEVLLSVGSKAWLNDAIMALFGQKIERESKRVPVVWMDSFLTTNCESSYANGGVGPDLWACFGKRFKDDRNHIGSCSMLFFADCTNYHWTFFAGDTFDHTWTWFDGLELQENLGRKSGQEAPRRITNLAKQLTWVMNEAAIQYPTIQAYQRFRGKWTLSTVHCDKIPVQTEGWSCGHRVLLLADMLASGYQVDDLQKMYSQEDMPAIHREMGHCAMVLMENAAPQFFAAC